MVFYAEVVIILFLNAAYTKLFTGKRLKSGKGLFGCHKIEMMVQ